MPERVESESEEDEDGPGSGGGFMATRTGTEERGDYVQADKKSSTHRPLLSFLCAPSLHTHSAATVAIRAPTDDAVPMISRSVIHSY